MCQGLLKDNDILNTVMNILRRCSKWDGCRNVSCLEQQARQTRPNSGGGGVAEGHPRFDKGGGGVAIIVLLFKRLK